MTDQEQVKAHRQALARFLPAESAHAPGGRRSGCLLGDVMGMGKTISAISGLLLREFVGLLECDKPRSTLVVVPNELLKEQWIEHLAWAGIPSSQVLEYRGDYRSNARQGKAELRDHPYPRVVICVKSRLQSEMLGAFKYPNIKMPLAPLTTNASRTLLAEMYDAKQQGGNKHEAKRRAAAAAGKPAPRAKSNAKTDPAAPARVAASELRSYEHSQLPWRTVIIDEVHELRNAFAYWSMAGLLACQQSLRAVLLSGTPFNNTMSDLVTIGAMIDATSLLATERFYAEKEAAGEIAFPPSLYLRRGKDQLQNPLPTKHVQYVGVTSSAEEIAAYEPKEHALLKTLKQLMRARLKRAHTPAQIRRKRRVVFRLSKQFLAQAHPARMAMVHPVLPGEQREVSHLFSASRRLMGLPPLKRDKWFCACCHPDGIAWLGGADDDDDDDEEERDLHGFTVDMDEVEAEEAIREGKRRRGGDSGSGDEGGDEEDGDDDDERAELEKELADLADAEDADDSVDDHMAADNSDGATASGPTAVGTAADSKDDARPRETTPSKGCPCSAGDCELVNAPRSLCGQPAARAHHVHKCCLEDLMCMTRDVSGTAAYPQCPRCVRHRTHLCQGCDEEEHAQAGVPLTICDDVMDANEEPLGGLKLSSKLLKALSLVEALPAGDKAIVFSWFKGALDLAEAALLAQCGIHAARIDGDLAADVRSQRLEAFKGDASARVLLLTLSTGGVGLNIQAANHCIFLDGWWNPAVIEQAIDRTHRLGQTKEVHVHMLYAKDTFDEVIRNIATMKAGAAKSLLGDDESQTMLGGRRALDASGLNDRDYKGLIQGIQEVITRRQLASSGVSEMPPYPPLAASSSTVPSSWPAVKLEQKLCVGGEARSVDADDTAATVKREAGTSMQHRADPDAMETRGDDCEPHEVIDLTSD